MSSQTVRRLLAAIVAASAIAALCRWEGWSRTGPQPGKANTHQFAEVAWQSPRAEAEMKSADWPTIRASREASVRQQARHAFQIRRARNLPYLRLLLGRDIPDRERAAGASAAATLAKHNPLCVQRHELAQRVNNEFLSGRDAYIAGWVGVVERVRPAGHGSVFVDIRVRPEVESLGGLYFCLCERAETWRLKPGGEPVFVSGTDPKTERVQYLID